MNYNKVKLTKWQDAVFIAFTYENFRMHILRAGRRSGKNFIVLILLIKMAFDNPGSTSVFIGKTGDSAKRTGYEPMIQMLRDQLRTPEDPFCKNLFKPKGDSTTIFFENGSKVIFKGSGNADVIRGEEVDGIFVCDEIDFHSKGGGAVNNFFENFEAVYRPATSKTQAKFIFTSTPFGVGMPLHKLWLKGEKPENQQKYYLSHITAYDAGIVPHEELDDAKKDMTPYVFEQEYMADFKSGATRVYPHFSDQNIRSNIRDLGIEIHIGLDHNVAQSVAAIGQIVGDSFEVFDEIKLTNSNTREMAIAIKTRYPNRSITVYPDPTGKARKTSAEIGVTDHTILEQEGLRVFAPRKPYLIVDRINTVNNKVYAADGSRSFYVSDKCSDIIEAMSFHLYDTEKGTPMKGSSDHYDDTADSVGYVIMGVFKFELNSKRTKSFKSNTMFG